MKSATEMWGKALLTFVKLDWETSKFPKLKKKWPTLWRIIPQYMAL
jgi:hypothetical protein